MKKNSLKCLEKYYLLELLPTVAKKPGAYVGLNKIIEKKISMNEIEMRNPYNNYLR